MCAAVIDSPIRSKPQVNLVQVVALPPLSSSLSAQSKYCKYK